MTQGMKTVKTTIGAGRGVTFAGLLLVLTCAASSAQQPNVQPSAKTASQILSRMAENTKGLTSYQVAFHVDMHVMKGFFSVRVPMDGMSYFKAPDKSMVKMTQVPSVAKDFTNIYGWVGTPHTWPSIYDITLEPTSSSGIYELRGTYKANAPTHVALDKSAGSTLDHVLLDVDARTFDPIRVSWFYKNGSTIVMNVTTQAVEGKYHLPQSESLDMNIPHQHADALVTYSTYQTNIAIPDSTFSK
jgi:hypothetical protein